MEPEQLEVPSDGGLLVSQQELSGPLQSLPPVEFAFAYGSGVFHQQHASSERMVDYILGVSSPSEWHSQNIKTNRKHYSSFLASFGGKTVADAARHLGVGVHFNPFVQWQDKVIKYGVIGLSDLVEDVETWKRLYISGRLQKPVCILVDECDMTKRNETNLRAALSAALLLLPYRFREEELYETLCGLSYQGDVRLLFAEDKYKVSKIVQGNLSNFKSLYNDTIHEAASKDMFKLSSGWITQEQGTELIRSHVARLPSTLLKRLASKTGTRYDAPSAATATADALVKEGLVVRPRVVRQAIASIVRNSSVRQAVSGLLGVGGANAIRYTAKKIAKAWRSS